MSHVNQYFFNANYSESMDVELEDMKNDLEEDMTRHLRKSMKEWLSNCDSLAYPQVQQQPF